ncbi:MAG: hypothetical protein COT26_01930 [Candidatus Kerfeldbacteria bacterium CG08_land_8_20_14_0_20_43_14]|uniref:Uncharacterized protein n=1 Tax=Candidatus Kerfeldbacteria bacterium CG08_land_8_20_14_0_20_43_14 TaxID=2014246 RepID=A0A2H0YSH2_9BACT|nr:MAG: hypothetical protein COT26_01930 [Candidatus Kerfeldbacteria bacterium CG08_land_8_20_14_0_20_43_14]
MISLWLLLIPFGLLVIVWLFLSIAAVLKMLRFGFLSRTAVISTFAFLVFSIAVFATSIISLSQVDWSASYTFGTPSINLPNVNGLKDRIPQIPKP